MTARDEFSSIVPPDMLASNLNVGMRSQMLRRGIKRYGVTHAARHRVQSHPLAIYTLQLSDKYYNKPHVVGPTKKLMAWCHRGPVGVRVSHGTKAPVPGPANDSDVHLLVPNS